MTQPADPAKPSTPKREWSPRIWEGCDFFAWMRLLSHNRFAVHLTHLYIAVVVTLVSIFHTLLRWLQRDVYGSKPANTPIKDAPIFIIGHWRTGTTLLHELLILDERHTYPNTYQCLEPNHFLLTEHLVRRYLPFLMPSRRPMDNMKAGWDRPQEDEFGLCMMGQPSPYLMVAFPNRPPMDQDAFSLETLPPRKREAWKKAFLNYLRHLNYKDPRRLILKSPTHSCRIRTLLELFPDARFIHIVRNPYVVFPSTVNLWKALFETHGLQKPNNFGLDEYVMNTFTMLYAKLEEGRRLVGPGRFVELRYEDLIRDPVAGMQQLYAHLGLDGFEKVKPRIEAYLAANRDYQTNRYPNLSEQTRAEIARRWGNVIQQYGYTDPAEASGGRY
jgi:omega-hydroxy-beta-dihydromenaquinone-9 sulfotransferase